MLFVVPFTPLAKYKKQWKSMRNEYRLYEDVLDAAVRDSLEVRFADAVQAMYNRDLADLPGILATLRQELSAALPTPKIAWAAEWFDILVSALAVAFCFRAYYYEPFQIPTGSMQPTLYGIHSESNVEPTFWDKGPMKVLKWCITGETYREVRVKASGIVSGYLPSGTPGYASLIINQHDRYDVPEDAVDTLRRAVPPGRRVAKGELLWNGYVCRGDFLFVNRWIWNFRHPRLGETIVFSTQGISPMLPDNQHYIKRLCGRPGDEVEISSEDHYLRVNGRKATSPSRLEEIALGRQPWEGSPPYPGYQPAQPTEVRAPNGQVIAVNPQTQFSLGPFEYLALGDNATNSLDSRYWGKVPSKNLLGPATFVHWPFASPRWGKIR